MKLKVKYDTHGILVDIDEYLSLQGKPKGKRRIVRILGASGSGKSEFGRQLMKLDPNWFVVCELNSNKVVTLCTVFPKFKVGIIGCYIKLRTIQKLRDTDVSLKSLDLSTNEHFRTSGSGDGIKNKELKTFYFKRCWDLDVDLYIEGSIISSQDVYFKELAKSMNEEREFKRKPVNVLLQPTYEKCVERIIARGGKVENSTIKSKHSWFANKAVQLAKDEYVSFVKIDNSDTPKEETPKLVLSGVGGV